MRRFRMFRCSTQEAKICSQGRALSASYVESPNGIAFTPDTHDIKKKWLNKTSTLLHMYKKHNSPYDCGRIRLGLDLLDDVLH